MTRFEYRVQPGVYASPHASAVFIDRVVVWPFVLFLAVLFWRARQAGRRRIVAHGFVAHDDPYARSDRSDTRDVGPVRVRFHHGPEIELTNEQRARVAKLQPGDDFHVYVELERPLAWFELEGGQPDVITRNMIHSALVSKSALSVPPAHRRVDIVAALAALLLCGLIQAYYWPLRVLRDHGVETVATIDRVQPHQETSRGIETHVYFTLDVHFTVNDRPCRTTVGAPREVGVPAIPGDEVPVVVAPNDCDNVQLASGTQPGVRFDEMIPLCLVMGVCLLIYASVCLDSRELTPRS